MSKHKQEDIRRKFGYDPIKAAQDGGKESVPVGRSLYSDALDLVIREGVELIRPLLNSGKEPGLSCALYVFSELTSKQSAALVDDIIPHIKPPKPVGRWSLIEGLMQHIEKLSYQETATFLQYCEDEEPSVRHKISEAVAFMPLSKLEGAAPFLRPSPALNCHLEGIQLQLRPHSKETVELAMAKSSSVLNCYVFAKLYREACLGRYHSVPESFPKSEQKYLEEMIASKKRMNELRVRWKKK